MSNTSILAFVIASALVAALGIGAMLLSAWHMKRSKKQESVRAAQQERGRRLARARRFRGRLPSNFRFDRSEANER